ncbi:MAG: nucleotidyltransferase family protein [Candidatus Sumerlaeia bacterium]|nr:nucleotidyltransferase family protein [Candidatus Sumerlaeia bacterium]
MSPRPGGHDAPLGPLPPAEARRFRRTIGQLARPDLAPRHLARLRTLLASPAWQPLPRIAPTLAIEPLLAHHAVQLGVGFDRLLDRRAGDVRAAVPDFAQLARNDALRRAALGDLLADCQRAATGPILLVKGAALAPLWPSPALRTMEDLDAVIQPPQQSAVLRALARGRWRSSPIGWVHRNGVVLDLQVATTPLARELIRSAAPHPSLPAPAMLPDHAAHLVLIALHTMRHGGLRIWRDLVDIQFMVESLADSRDPARALQLACAYHAAESLAALFRLANRWTAPRAPLPERPEAHWSPEAERRCRQHLRLFEQLMTDRVSEYGLYAMASLGGSPHNLVAAVAGRLRRGGGSASRPAEIQAHQRDPVWGDIPPPRNWARQLAKLHVLLIAWRAGLWPHYRRLIHHVRATTPRDRVFDALRIHDSQDT